MSGPRMPRRGVTPGLPTNAGSFKAAERGEAAVTLGASFAPEDALAAELADPAKQAARAQYLADDREWRHLTGADQMIDQEAAKASATRLNEAVADTAFAEGRLAQANMAPALIRPLATRLAWRRLWKAREAERRAHTRYRSENGLPPA